MAAAVGSGNCSDAVSVGAPGLDLLFDHFGGEVFAGGFGGERGEFRVGGEAERDDLVDAEICRQQLAGEDEVAEVFFGANTAVLCLEGEATGEEGRKEYTQGEHNDKRGAVDALVVANRIVKVDEGSHEAKEKHETEGKKCGYALGVVL